MTRSGKMFGCEPCRDFVIVLSPSYRLPVPVRRTWWDSSQNAFAASFVGRRSERLFAGSSLAVERLTHVDPSLLRQTSNNHHYV